MTLGGNKTLVRFILLTLMVGAAAAQTVSQTPLSVGGDVPGNLLLVPSVEWPTLDGVANLGDYDVARVYVGYFDPGKCYRYTYSLNEPDRYFFPVSVTATRTCSNTQRQWSGNYLNWAATQTIDPFRKALTGGYRVRDAATETWVEKARYDSNGGTGVYPNRRIPAGLGSSSSLVRGATPASWNDLTIRIRQLGNRMRFTRTGDLDTLLPTAYNPTLHTTLNESTVYEVSVRVKVCDSSIGVEANCKQYSQGWKPEGLIQQYSGDIRYSVFGYLNDADMLRDGGALRAKQKFVGEQQLDPTTGGTVANPNREWNPTTGVLVRNPDTADATATTSAVGQTIADSGVINYINKFGQMTTQDHKTHDPVSELYYTAIRYLKNQGNVPAYTSLSGTSTQRYNLADGFPVITAWQDPLQYWCQNNAILGIGDVYTHRDKNLPGNTRTPEEPVRPTAVSGDTTVNVVTATQKVAQLEGITIATPFTNYENSAYIAGLAYDSHTKDLRPDLNGDQTVSTHWVDVRENQVLEPRTRNQYWLAAKYGGFAVPDDFDPYTRTAALDPSLWSSGETLSNGNLRPENFYVASEADKMVESLTRAFAKIAAESVGSASSLASNSTRLETGTKTFQAQFFSGSWRGELNAYSVASDGSLSATPLWRASAGLATTAWATRPIYVYNPQGGNNKKYMPFTWANLGANQTAALGSQAVVDYLRGNRSNEQAQANGTLRTRTGILGDIVNSTPLYVGAPNARLYVGATFTGASDYRKFVSKYANRTPVVYVGANDGMLHGFNANTGAETYAFVPNATILNGLRQYSDPTYQHRYFVDGELAIADIYDTSSKDWKTVLVGTLGRGGPGVFALDVTDPADVKFLWEKRGTDIAALGKNIGRPIIAQVANGDWRVVIGNGPGATGGSAQLISIRLRDGAVTVADTGITGSNGLTAALVRDADSDGFAETGYAGDLRGNLWKFTGLSGTPSATRLFQARDPSGNAQPITAAPLVGRDPATGTVWVFFGTGQYLSSTDLTNKQIQTWYGLKDTGSSISGRNVLVARDILAESQVGDLGVRVVEEGAVGDLVSARGWFMDLVSPTHGAEGERMVVPSRFQGPVLIGTTRIPVAGDACRPGGRGFVMAINPFTGARLDATFFDVSRDGKFNASDMLMVDGVLSIVSGIGLTSSPSSPLFIDEAMQIGLDDGTMEVILTQASSGDASRISWRELGNRR